MFEKQEHWGAGGRRDPPICKPLRNVAVADEDALLDMKRAHVKKRGVVVAGSPPICNH